jgi:hypothetical protein
MTNPAFAALAYGPVYVSGPMTGYADHNYPAFNAVTAILRNAGLVVVNPAEINAPGVPYALCLRKDLRQLLDCENIVLLAGWSQSRGANMELAVAKIIGCRVFEWNTYSTYGALTLFNDNRCTIKDIDARSA